MMSTDAALLEAWQSGDQRAGKQLFERYFVPVNRFFRNKAGTDAQDLVQRTFLGCLESVDRYRGEADFRSWLFGIAYKQLCKHYRTRASERANFDVALVSAYDFDATPSQVLAQREEHLLLLEGLRRIPIDMQVVLELRYWEKMSDAEIARTLELPLGTLKSRMRRARQLLAKQITGLATSPIELDSTLGGLDDWADQLREAARER